MIAGARRMPSIAATSATSSTRTPAAPSCATTSESGLVNPCGAITIAFAVIHGEPLLAWYRITRARTSCRVGRSRARRLRAVLGAGPERAGGLSIRPPLDVDRRRGSDRLVLAVARDAACRHRDLHVMRRDLPAHDCEAPPALRPV